MLLVSRAVLTAVAMTTARKSLVIAYDVSPWLPTFSSRFSFGASSMSAEASRYFSAGMLHMAGFNRPEGRKAFEAAVARDPTCALCHWGLAYSCGPTPGDKHSFDGEAAKRAARAAQALLQDGDRGGSALERGLVSAMAARFASGDEDVAAYLGALRRLRGGGLEASNSSRATAEALFAEALLLAVPGRGSQRYHANNTMAGAGPPHPLVLEALVALEGVIGSGGGGSGGGGVPGEGGATSAAAVPGLDPHHPLALHLFVHAAEGRPLSDRRWGPRAAEGAAARLGGRAGGGVGHLLHMPSHIWARVGRYQDSVEANARALEVRAANAAANAAASFVSPPSARGEPRSPPSPAARAAREAARPFDWARPLPLLLPPPLW